MDGGAREASAERGAYHVRPAEFERRDYEPDSARARAREAFVPREPRHAQPRRPLAAGAATRLNLAVDLSLVSGILFVDGLLTLPDNSGLPALALLLLLVAAVWVFAGSAVGYYDATANGRELLDDVALVSTMVMGMMFVVALFNLAAPRSMPIGHILLFCWPTTILMRIAFFRPASRWERPVDETVIVGTGALARITGEDLERRGRQRVIGFLFFADEQRPHVLTWPLLGTWMDLENVLRTKPVNEVYIAGDGIKHASAVQHAIAVCENLGIPFALPAYTFRLQRARPIPGKAVADGYLHYAVVEAKIGQRAVKRICDVLIASLALWLLAPLFLVAAVLIKATSRGPVFFRQLRCGLHGKPFEMLKFRSMLADAEQRRKTLEALNERNGPVFKMRNDPRVTRIGALLRKYSIDEVPQLINVLRGEMSIVGPRPPIPEEVAKYQSWQLRRLSVRPGLTCSWQISADRHEMSFDEWMYLDLQYVDHWNLLKDAELILGTIPVVVTGRGEPVKGAAARYNLNVSAR
jgi:exopolysaccharide biosynthesis polyprenyl glycosylphosphotransferase